MLGHLNQNETKKYQVTCCSSAEKQILRKLTFKQELQRV